MKSKTRVCSAAAVLFFITVLSQLSVGAETYFIDSDYKYTYRYDGTVAVAGYMGTSSELDIPEKISGKNVTEISWSAFYGKKGITEVNFPDTLKLIGDSAFSGCVNIKDLSIPASVTYIGANAFYSCTSLKTIEIKGKISSIEKYTFNRCVSVEKIILPETVRQIGEYAFYGCKSLEYVYIPAATTYIEEHAFDGCTNLVIYGYNGSYAEAFADKKGISFVSLGDTEDEKADGQFSGSLHGSYNKFENNNAGDLNGDGLVNYLDCQVLQKFLAKINDCFYGERYYDFNTDGRFNILDVTFLQIKMVFYL